MRSIQASLLPSGEGQDEGLCPKSMRNTPALRFCHACVVTCELAATAVLGMTGIEAAFSLLWAPFAASVAFVLIHSYFGIHVLRRNVVFADLALSQLAALGATIAFAIGYPPLSMAGFAYAFLFTLLGAVLLTLQPAGCRLRQPGGFRWRFICHGDGVDGAGCRPGAARGRACQKRS